MGKSGFEKCQCIGCDETLYFNVNNFDETRLVICPKCNYKYTSLECPHCNNIDFKDDFTDNPSAWVCEKCGQKVNFPEDFYEKPFYFIEEENVPEDDMKKIKNKKRLELTQWIVFTVFFLSCLGYVVYYSIANR